jgi:hypothetical protein
MSKSEKTINGMPIELYCGELYKHLTYIREQKLAIYNRYKNSETRFEINISTIKERLKLKQLNDTEKLYIQTLNEIINIMKS